MTEKPRIRKVWLPSEMKAALEEYCWQNKMRPSPMLAGIIREFKENPSMASGLDVPPAGKDYASVYISDDDWSPAVAEAEAMGTTLSAVVRAVLGPILTAAGLSWETETRRPRHERIPIRE